MLLLINNTCNHKNGSYCIYQRFQRINEANGSICIVLTHEPRLHAVLNKRSFDRRLNCNKSYYNFLNCDWFKKLLFPTNSLAKLLSDSLLSDSSTNQSHSKM